MKPTSISFKKILSHSKLIYTDRISLQSVELNWFIPDEDLACNKVLETGCTESAHSWRCLRWCPGAGELWLVENSCRYFHHTLGRCSSAHPVKEGVVGCNPDMAWRWHSRIHCSHLSFYFERLRDTEWESVDFSMLHPFSTVRSRTLQWKCQSWNTSNMY